MSAEPAIEPLAGTLHVHVAFDWGEEVDFDGVRRLVSAERLTLARRSRTPASVAFRPSPLQVKLPGVKFALAELGSIEAAAEATLFDFGAVSVAMHVPFQLVPQALVRLAGSLSESEAVVAACRAALAPLYGQLLPAIQEPSWSELREEYFVFHFPPGSPLLLPERLLGPEAAWTAALVRLEDQPLSAAEIAEALRLPISYAPDDLFVAEWSAAVLVDRECEETLQTVEFANLQLLEYRHIDTRLDDRLTSAYRLMHPLVRTRLPLWRTHHRQLRELGDLRIEAHDVFERTGNVLKLVGDQYLARLYQILVQRFHLKQWEQSIERAFGVLEGTYQVVADQAAHYRTEMLEWIVIALISFEIVMAWLRH